jgi:hypothetical protein
MSTLYFAWSFPIRETDLPSQIHSCDDVLAFMNCDIAKGRTLASASRNDWLADKVASISSQFGDATLAFLVSVECGSVQDGSGYSWFVSTLDSAQVNNAIIGCERLLEYARQHPWHFAAMLGQGSAVEIVEALQASTSRYDPIKGPEGEEEGDGPVYLFAYLKSLISLLRYAQEQDFYIVHARHAQ